MNLIYKILFVLLLILGIILRFTDLRVPFRTPDEITYTTQAKKIAQGRETIKSLICEYNKNKELWLYPFL